MIRHWAFFAIPATLAAALLACTAMAEPLPTRLVLTLEAAR
jgi:hypothetical protein